MADQTTSAGASADNPATTAGTVTSAGDDKAAKDLTAPKNQGNQDPNPEATAGPKTKANKASRTAVATPNEGTSQPLEVAVVSDAKDKQPPLPTPAGAAEAAKPERLRVENEKSAQNKALEEAGLVQPGAPITSYEHERAVYPTEASPEKGTAVKK